MIMATKLTIPAITTVAALTPTPPVRNIRDWLDEAPHWRKSAQKAAKSAVEAVGHAQWAKLETAIADLINAMH
jgi:hypothetical protein